jgi:DNA-binding transcriptional regulator YdaS (Cro superfamily)
MVSIQPSLVTHKLALCPGFAWFCGRYYMTTPTIHDAALQKAIAIAGSYSALARALGCRYQAVQRWTRVPPLRVLAVEAATGVPREVLRLDLYPPEDGRRRGRVR